MKSFFIYLVIYGMLLVQAWLLYLTLTPSPAPSQWGFIDERVFSVQYVLVSLLTVFIAAGRGSLIKRWMVWLPIVMLLIIFGQLVYFSDYYENEGDLSWSIDVDGENPILYNERTGNYPPAIGVLYGLFVYHVLLALLLRWISRRKKY